MIEDGTRRIRVVVTVVAIALLLGAAWLVLVPRTVLYNPPPSGAAEPVHLRTSLRRAIGAVVLAVVLAVVAVAVLLALRVRGRARRGA